MQIILKEDIIGLGYKNEIVDVKPGYGRNYLIPSGKGVIARKSSLRTCVSKPTKSRLRKPLHRNVPTNSRAWR